MKYIDCHAHIFAENALDYKEQCTGWHQNSVERILNVFCLETDLDIAKEVLQSPNKYPNVYFIAGVTPHGADKFNKEHEEFLFSHCDQLIAIGETGLDFHYNLSDRKRQTESFIRHLEIACELQKPIVLHLRDADTEAREILKDFVGKIPGVMLHCYTSGEDLAKWSVEQGFYISASGIVTFNKSQPLREIFKQVPLKQLLVETDSPYLAPPPYRGKTNQSAYIVETYKFLSQMYDIPLQELSDQVWQNSETLFSLSK
ncbi:TatD family hydrolase [Candidatus Uabimicrobium sp. HlEnr_7]|uniref:TatD family hydrolase n=1 Tax=Candidatus Uabimicrobium helgolandensis TaxID=3095367 RepID=UPI003556722B